MPLLSFHDVSVAYEPSRPVLRDVDLAVRRGELVAVVGPNGAGKSTLLRLASGWLVPDRGRVELEGRDLRSYDRREAARLVAGALAEGEPAFPFTVGESVALGRHPWRGHFGALGERDREAIARALADADLEALESRPVTALSTGERQRVAVARCLAQDADLFLLDEPTAHLDLTRRARILSLFRRRAREEEKGVLAVLHDLSLAGLLADRVVLLVGGRVRAEGAPAEVLRPDLLAGAFEGAVRVLADPSTGGPVPIPDLGGET